MLETRMAAAPSSPHLELAEWLGNQLDQVEPLRDEAQRSLLTEAKRHPIIRNLATAPGMGPIRTAQVVAIVATPERFQTRRQFWSYCGRGIVTRSSADWARDKGQKWVRTQVTQTRGLTLIALYLRDCVTQRRKLAMEWPRQRKNTRPSSKGMKQTSVRSLMQCRESGRAVEQDDEVVRGKPLSRGALGSVSNRGQA
jgi:transposase